MTINPPNFILPNITVLTGVVETDNLRRNFTFNLRIKIPNIKVEVPKYTMLAAFVPVPRYFADDFELVFAEDLFPEEIVQEEIQASKDAITKRHTTEMEMPHTVGRDYYVGRDVYGNYFSDHQKPSSNRKETLGEDV